MRTERSDEFLILFIIIFFFGLSLRELHRYRRGQGSNHGKPSVASSTMRIFFLAAPPRAKLTLVRTRALNSSLQGYYFYSP